MIQINLLKTSSDASRIHNQLVKLTLWDIMYNMILELYGDFNSRYMSLVPTCVRGMCILKHTRASSQTL